MGRQSRGSRKVMVRLEYSRQRFVPIPARFVDVQLAELFEHLPPGHLSPAIWPAVVRHGLRVPNPHVLAHGLEPCPHELTAPIAADDSWDIKNRQPMPDHGISDGLGLQPHSMLVLLVLLLGLLARDRHDIPAVPVHRQDDTVVGLSFQSDLRHGEYLHGHGPHRGLRYSRIHRVARRGVVGALCGPAHGAVAAVLVQEGVLPRWELEAQLQVLLHLVPTRMHELGVMPVLNELLHSVLRDQ